MNTNLFIIVIYQINNNVRIAQQSEYTKMHVTLGERQLFIARSVLVKDKLIVLFVRTWLI